MIRNYLNSTRYYSKTAAVKNGALDWLCPSKQQRVFQPTREFNLLPSLVGAQSRFTIVVILYSRGFQCFHSFIDRLERFIDMKERLEQLIFVGILYLQIS